MASMHARLVEQWIDFEQRINDLRYLSLLRSSIYLAVGFTTDVGLDGGTGE